MNNKKTIIGGLLFIIIGSAAYWWYNKNKKNAVAKLISNSNVSSTPEEKSTLPVGTAPISNISVGDVVAQKPPINDILPIANPVLNNPSISDNVYDGTVLKSDVNNTKGNESVIIYFSPSTTNNLDYLEEDRGYVRQV